MRRCINNVSTQPGKLDVGRVAAGEVAIDKLTSEKEQVGYWILMQRCLESWSGHYLSVLQLGGLIISTPTPTPGMWTGLTLCALATWKSYMHEARLSMMYVYRRYRVDRWSGRCILTGY